MIDFFHLTFSPKEPIAYTVVIVEIAREQRMVCMT